jgi:hypothetical protein
MDDASRRLCVEVDGGGRELREQTRSTRFQLSNCLVLFVHAHATDAAAMLQPRVDYRSPFVCSFIYPSSALIFSLLCPAKEKIMSANPPVVKPPARSCLLGA